MKLKVNIEKREDVDTAEQKRDHNTLIWVYLWLCVAVSRSSFADERTIRKSHIYIYAWAVMRRDITRPPAEFRTDYVYLWYNVVKLCEMLDFRHRNEIISLKSAAVSCRNFIVAGCFLRRQ